MTLLTEVMQRPLDPGYAAAAARHEKDGRDRRGRGRGVATTVVLAVLAGGLLVVGVSELRVPRSADTLGLLREEVSARTAEVEARSAGVEELRAEIDGLRDARLDAVADPLLDQVATLELLAGAVPVSGPGAVYTLDDAAGVSDPLSGDPREGTADEEGRVLDVDLQVVVNGLWAAGAEAVSVNGHRLTSTTAIRAAGPAIVVDVRPIAPPYVVEAIGDPSTLQTEFARSFAGTYLESLKQNHGVRATIAGARDLRLDAGDALTLQYATRTGELEDRS